MNNNINPELKIKELLDDLRPFLNGDGACANCGFQDETISFGIEAYLKDQVPEIEGVINVEF